MGKAQKILKNIEEGFLGYTLLAMVFFCFLQVILRYIFGRSLGWMEELLRYLMILMTFVGAGVGVRYGAHFAVETIFKITPDRYSHALKMITDLICFSCCALFSYFGFVFVLKSRMMSQTSPTLLIPMYIPYLIIPIGCLFMAIGFLLNFFKDGIGMMKGKPFLKQ